MAQIPMHVKDKIVHICNNYIHVNRYFLHNRESSSYKRDHIKKIVSILNNFDISFETLLSMLDYTKKNVDENTEKSRNFLNIKPSQNNFNKLLQNIHKVIVDFNPTLNLEIIAHHGQFLSAYQSIPYFSYIVFLRQFFKDFSEIFLNPAKTRKLFYILWLLRDQCLAIKLDQYAKFKFQDREFTVNRKYANLVVSLFIYPESNLLYVCHQTKTIAKFSGKTTLISNLNTQESEQMEHALGFEQNGTAQFIFISMMKELSKNGSPNLKQNLSKALDNLPYSALISYEHLLSYLGRSFLTWTQSRTLLAPMDNRSEYGSNLASIVKELLDIALKSLGLSYFALAKGVFNMGINSIRNYMGWHPINPI